MSISGLSQITTTDIFEKDSHPSKESIIDQVRIIRAFEGGWDVSLEKRKGVYQATHPSHYEILRESLDEKTAITIEIDLNSNSILNAKRIKSQKEERPEN
jgi:hypothetical protein